MKHHAKKLLILFLLLALTSQPLLAQVRVLRDVTLPCPISMMQQQMQHHEMKQHGDCAAHAGNVCIDCDLCGHANSSVISQPFSAIGMHGDSEPADQFRSAFSSISLPVDSPPPRSL